MPKKTPPRSASKNLDLAGLVESIALADQQMSRNAIGYVSISLTLRNWLIGLYISEYELRGADRAQYGERMLTLLSEKLQARKVSNTGRRQLYQYLAFCRTYPEIVRAPSAQSALPGIRLPSTSKKARSASTQSSTTAEALDRVADHLDESAARGFAAAVQSAGFLTWSLVACLVAAVVIRVAATYARMIHDAARLP